MPMPKNNCITWNAIVIPVFVMYLVLSKPEPWLMSFD